MSKQFFVMFCPVCTGNRTFDRGAQCQSCGHIHPNYAPKQTLVRIGVKHVAMVTEVSNER